MSIVSLVFQIGCLIVSFLNEKRMSIDIIRKLFSIENKNRKNKNKLLKISASERVKLNIEKVNNSFQSPERNDKFCNDYRKFK